MRALTGKDTDRLPEEQERGISIDLGYAPLELPDGRRLSLVDVPGHERFVRNMVAGATGIDLFLLVIDAAEGARPQTHEHLAILRLLGIDRGVVAVTKADAVDEETLELAVEEARELVPEAKVVAVSAKTGTGLDELRAALGEARPTPSAPRSADASLRRPRLHVAGHRHRRHRHALVRRRRRGRRAARRAGGRNVRVRILQVHDAPVERAEAGQRVAVSLPASSAASCGAATPSSSRAVPAQLPARRRAGGARPIPPAVNVHHGTADVCARVVRAGAASRSCASPRPSSRRAATASCCGRNDCRRRHRARPGAAAKPRRRAVRTLESGDPAAIVGALVHAPVTGPELQARGLLAAAPSSRSASRRRSAGDCTSPPHGWTS